MSSLLRRAVSTGPNIIVGMCRWMLQGTEALMQCVQAVLEIKHILSLAWLWPPLCLRPGVGT
jgi:hypothetical protein